MISYAQNGEDVLLARLFSQEHPGFYVDVGAADPDVHSVTRAFYDRGWRGINIEPLPGFFALLERRRPRDVNLNVAVSASPGEADFFVSVGNEGISSLSSAWAAGGGQPVERHRVAVTTLSEVCAAHASEVVIDFLKIDVEGHERAVLEGFNFERFRPRVCVLEASSEELHDGFRDVLEDGRYYYAHFDGLNRYYVRDEDRHLCDRLHMPLCSLDDYVPYAFLEPLEHAAAQLAQVGDVEAARSTLTAAIRRLRTG